MSHHYPQNRSRANRESVPWSVAREVFIWNIDVPPEDHQFPGQLESGDMALRPGGEIYLWNGLEWFLLVASRSVLDKHRVKMLQESEGTLEVHYDDTE